MTDNRQHKSKKARLLIFKKQEPYFLFRRVLGFWPRKIDYYFLALRHRSLSVRRPDGSVLNNERLEYLGDAVLNTVVADLLYHRYETQGEGFLTETRARIVRRETLNRVALAMGLDRLLMTAANTNFQRQDIYGNTLEALLGAVFLDRGYRACDRFIRRRLIGRHLNVDDMAVAETNYKSMLLEWAQRQKAEVEYRVTEEPCRSPHDIVFCCDLYLQGKVVASASGYSKKNAQQKAAEKAWERISLGPDFVNHPTS